MQQDKGVMSSQVLDCRAVDLSSRASSIEVTLPRGDPRRVAFSGETNLCSRNGTQHSTSDCHVHRDDF